jgi:hypothetical protein
VIRQGELQYNFQNREKVKREIDFQKSVKNSSKNIKLFFFLRSSALYNISYQKEFGKERKIYDTQK